MPKLKDVVAWYNQNGWPLKCKYCGSMDNLTKDHIEAKSKTPQNVRLRRWRNKEKDPITYFSQFALVCKNCNYMKGCMSHNGFIEHIKQIINYTKE